MPIPASNVIVVHHRTDPERSIRWVQTLEGEWDATMAFFDPEQNYRLFDIDAVNLEQVFATINQYLRDDLPEVYLEPRDSALRRRIAGVTTMEDWATLKDAIKRA